MQELVDTHCHIQSIGQDEGERTTSEKWAKQPHITAENVIKEAAEHGVSRLICVGCDLDDSKLAISFALDKSNCWASIGIHPHEAKIFDGDDQKITEFKSLITQPKVVAIGECGLDYYYSHSPKQAQIAILKMQLQLAINNKLPVIFHVREAFEDFWPIYDEFPVRGVLHSYTDNADNLKKALDRGLYIGVNGIATFAKDPLQLEVYTKIPLSKLLLETDSPFLTPSPYRGNINVPKMIGTIADFLANLRGDERSNLAKITTANALKLFGLEEISI